MMLGIKKDAIECINNVSVEMLIWTEIFQPSFIYFMDRLLDSPKHWAVGQLLIPEMEIAW